MIGLLCSDNKEKAIVRAFGGTLKPMLCKTGEEVLVFTLSDADTDDKTTHGTLISCDGITAYSRELPELIFNLSQQRRYTGIKKVRALSEVKGITLYNAVNRYNQWAVGEILLAEESTAKYVLQEESLKSTCDPIGKDNKARSFILRPENGAARSKLVYIREWSNGFEVYNPLPHFCSREELQSKLSQAAQNGKWLLCPARELFVYGSRLFTARIWAQREADGKWSILQQVCTENLGSLLQAIEYHLKSAFRAIAEQIHCFIPSIHFCFIDFTFDLSGNPIFIGFGGWQECLITQRINPGIKEAICQNILSMRLANPAQPLKADRQD